MMVTQWALTISWKPVSLLGNQRPQGPSNVQAFQEASCASLGSRSGPVTQARPVKSRICEPHKDAWTAGAWSDQDHYHTQAEHEVKQCGRQSQWTVRNSPDESLCL